MASSPKGLRLLKSLEILKSKSNFDASIINKVKLKSASDGVLKGTFTIEPHMCNLGNTMHGGYIASVIDAISFYSQLSKPYGRVSWTTSMNIIYLSSGEIGETVNVETRQLKSGNLSVIETDLSNGTGKLLARGIISFVAGSEIYQQRFKDVMNFDVYEN